MWTSRAETVEQQDETIARLTEEFELHTLLRHLANKELERTLICHCADMTLRQSTIPNGSGYKINYAAGALHKMCEHMENEGYDKYLLLEQQKTVRELLVTSIPYRTRDGRSIWVPGDLSKKMVFRITLGTMGEDGECFYPIEASSADLSKITPALNLLEQTARK